MSPSTLPASRSLLTALSLSLAGLTGCGFGFDATPSGVVDPAADVLFVADSTPAPAITPDASLSTFSIDVGAGVTLDEATYAITTNGRDWTLAWRGDAYFRRFRGEVVNGSRFTNLVVDGLFAGDVARQTAPNRVAFDTHTDAGNIQSVTVRSGSEPVRFNLWIDGAPATYAVIFASGGIESTTDDMPFDLVTGGFVAARTAPRLAPERAQIQRVPAAAAPGTLSAASSAASAGSQTAARPFIPAPAARPESHSQ